MTKKELIDIIYDNSTYLKQEVTDIVNQVFEVMSQQLGTGDKVTITNFGTFEKVFQKEYYGVNAYTGERILIEGNYRISFVSSKKLKERINNKK